MNTTREASRTDYESFKQRLRAFNEVNETKKRDRRVYDADERRLRRQFTRRRRAFETRKSREDWQQEILQAGWKSVRSYRNACKKYWKYSCHLDLSHFGDIEDLFDVGPDVYTGTYGRVVLDIVDSFIYSHTSESQYDWSQQERFCPPEETTMPQSGKEESNVPVNNDPVYQYDSVQSVYDQYEDIKSQSSGKHVQSRKSRKDAKSRWKHYKPQSGLAEATKAFNKAFPTATNTIFNQLENFIAMCYGLSHSSTTEGATSTIFLYVKTITDRSLSCKLWTYIKHLFGSSVLNTTSLDEAAPLPSEDLEPVPEMFFPESGVDYMEAFRQLTGNFKTLVTHPAFSKISYLLSACVCLGLCEASTLSWSLGGITLFSPDVYRKHIHAGDLITAVLGTVTYFIEGGFEFFKTGSLNGFLYSDNSLRSVQDDYHFIRSNAVHFRTGNLLKHAKISDTDYSHKVESVLVKLKRVSVLSQGIEKQVVERMISVVNDIRVDFAATRTCGGIRPAPLTLFLRGKTAVGKSTLSCALPPIIGELLGFDGSPERTCTVRGDDKYQQNVDGSTNVIIFEDAFNTKSDFLETSPTNGMLVMSNNAIAEVNKADVDSKGKVTYCHHLFIINSNLPDGGASLGSNEPAAIERRFGITVDVRVDPAFTTSGGISLCPVKVRLHYEALGLPIPVLPDVWIVDIMRPVTKPNPTVGGKDITVYEPHLDNDGQPLIGVRITKFLEFVRDFGRKWQSDQIALADRVNNAHRNIFLCANCDMTSNVCSCGDPIPHLVTPESGLVTDLQSECRATWDATIASFTDYGRRTGGTLLVMLLAKIVGFTPDAVMGKFVKTMAYYGVINGAEYRPYKDPDLVLSGVLGFVWTLFHVVFYLSNCYFLKCNVLDVSCTTDFYMSYWYINPWFTSLVTALIAVYARRSWLVYKEREATLATNIALRSQHAFWLICHQVREVRIEQVLGVSAMLGVAYVMCKQFLNMKNVAATPQSWLMPEGPKDIAEQDLKQNIWLKVVKTPRPTNRQLTTATTEQVVNKIFNNMCYLRIKEDGGNRICDVVFLRTGVFVMPYHALFVDGNPTSDNTGDLELKFQRRSEDCLGATFKGYASRTSWIRIPNTDFALVRLDVGGDFADISYLLSEDLYEGMATFIYKESDGSMRQEGVTIKSGEVGHVYCRFKGGEYHLAGGTKQGLCMATLVSQDKEKRIVGFHLGGKGGTYGISGHLRLSEYQTTLAALSERNYIPHKEGEYPTEILGKRMVATEDIHPRSPVNYLAESGAINTYCGIDGGVTNTSQVVVSLISPTVGAIMGVENTWGKPVMKPDWLPWFKYLASAVCPSDGFSPDDMEWAKADYLAPILELMKRPYIQAMVRVLTDVEVVNGIPGMKFIDPINKSTSMGIPLNGAKSNYLVPISVDGYVDPVMFTDEILEEVRRIEDILASGNRCNAVFKACLKDEPTSVTKVKAARVIFVSPLAILFLNRKYFLMLTRLINLHPILFESMVGINCMGPEWEERRDYFTDKGANMSRTMNTDFSSYDQKLPAQLITAAFDVFIKICMASGNFTERHRMIMIGLATEETFPFVALNGTLISLCGTNISGTGLTVYKNNAANGLAQRLAYLNVELKPRNLVSVKSFRDGVKSGNYGDDNNSVVAPWVQHYNMITFADFCSEHGMTVTMADKTSEFVPFVHWDESDFLKRQDCYIPELGLHLGKLELASLYKSLHSNLRSKNLSREELSKAVMEGFSFEIFAHGREVHDEKIAQLREVAAIHNIDVPVLSKSFDDKVREWNETHRPQLLLDTALAEE